MTNWVVLWLKCVRNMLRWHQQHLRYNHLRLLVVVAWCAGRTMLLNIVTSWLAFYSMNVEHCWNIMTCVTDVWGKAIWHMDVLQLVHGQHATLPASLFMRWQCERRQCGWTVQEAQEACVLIVYERSTNPGDVAVKNENNDTFCCPNICLLDIWT